MIRTSLLNQTVDIAYEQIQKINHLKPGVAEIFYNDESKYTGSISGNSKNGKAKM